MDYTISPYTSADRDDLLRMYRRYLAEEADIPCSEQGVSELLSEIEADATRYPFWMRILRVGTEAAGFCMAQIDTKDNFWCGRAGFGCIREFSVEPPYRGLGLGRMLAADLEAFLRQNGASGIYLTALPDAGGRFWEHLGYKKTDQRFSLNRLPIYQKENG